MLLKEFIKCISVIPIIVLFVFQLLLQTLTVEWDHTIEGESAITRLMENNKFVKFGHIEMAYSREVVYVKDFLDDLRLYE